MDLAEQAAIQEIVDRFSLNQYRAAQTGSNAKGAEQDGAV